MTEEPAAYDHPLARIYINRALDPIIEVARALSEDFFKRPHHYQRVPDDIADLLTNFRSLTGNHPEWPDSSQRTLTASRALGRFSQSLVGVRRAAMAFIHRVPSHSETIVRQSFVEEAALLRSTVKPLEGAALSRGERRDSDMLKRAITVLAAKDVSAVFGLAVAPVGDWPDGGLYSPQLAYLCESVSRCLNIDNYISQPKFSVLQRAAHYGSMTIGEVLDPSFTEPESRRFPVVIKAATSWAAALRDLLVRIDIVRAWREPAYRNRLQALEKDLIPPHPAGDIDLSGTSLSRGLSHELGFVGLVSDTAAGEVCCSGGETDLCSTNGDCDLTAHCDTDTCQSPACDPDN